MLSRRAFLRLLGLAGAATVVGCSDDNDPPRRAAGPAVTVTGILLHVTDDQELGLINAEVMPFLHSQPGGHWKLYPNASTSTPLCGPSRASLLTGQRCDHNGIINNTTTAIVEADLITHPLAVAGVAVGIFGKRLNQDDTAVLPPSDVDGSWIVHTGDGESTYYEGWEATRTDGTVEDEADYPGEYLMDIIYAKAAAWIDAQTGRWLAIVCPTAPHYQAIPADRHAATALDIDDPPDWNQAVTNGPTWLADYGAMSAGEQTTTRAERLNAARSLLAVDEGLADLFDVIDLGTTMVISCTDNSVAMGRKRIGNTDRTSYKTSPFEYASNGQLRIRHPDATAGTDERLVDFLDLPATILEHFAASPTVTLDGRDIMPLILDTPETATRTASFSMFIGTQPGNTIPKWRRVRTERWRYANYFEAEEQELYDLLDDPNETVNVAASYPDVIAVMETAEAALLADPHAVVVEPRPAIPAVVSIGGVPVQID